MAWRPEPVEDLSILMMPLGTFLAGRRSSETGLEELEAGGSRQWSSKESLGFSRRGGVLGSVTWLLR